MTVLSWHDIAMLSAVGLLLLGVWVATRNDPDAHDELIKPSHPGRRER